MILTELHRATGGNLNHSHGLINDVREARATGVPVESARSAVFVRARILSFNCRMGRSAMKV
ncbi:hypothetical protein [Streptomyces milbemycinicus]|uniref:hypothetical protein n=1 Tax=Streptomyces milbemycinicus TaxID=476552 RepID=UPI0033D7FB20